MNIQFAAKSFISGLLAACLLSLSWQSYAEDIDLFLGPSATGSEIDIPNVLFVVDNTANWSNIFDSEMGALQTVFESLPSGEIRVGLLMFSESGGQNKGPDGGYVRAAIRTMIDAGDGLVSTKQLYSDMIADFDKIKDRSNSGKSSKAMAEAFFYFDGAAAKAGKEKLKTDYLGNTYNSGNCCAASVDVWELDAADYGLNALDAFNTSPYLYNSPVIDGSCGGNYIIFIGNGPAQDSNSDNTEAGNWLAAELGEAPVEIPLDTALASENWADEWAQYMKDSDLEITTFTVDINRKPNSGQGPNWTLLMQSMADVSGGTYYDLRGETTFDPNDLIAALDDALSRILAVDSVFASVALPATAGAQSTFLNQVFIGLFRPDGDGKPRWPGNLKQYQFGRVGADDELKIVDADGASITDSGEGLITECARSFWTDDTTGSGRPAYWEFLYDDLDKNGNPVVEPEPEFGCLTGGSSAFYDTPDGSYVEKGAQAFMLRESDPAARNVLTCSSTFTDCNSSGDLLTDFLTSESFPTEADLGVSGIFAAVLRTAYIDWARGKDIFDVNEDGSSSDMRPYVHGDVVHSQPAAHDYAADPNDPEVVVFYGANDGMLRAINGNQTAALGSVPAGGEIWSFMPPEFFSSIPILALNNDTVKFPASGTSAPAGGINKPYGMDGPLTLYTADTTGDGAVDKRWLFAGMRRGGRVLYAFDVTTAATPTLKWKKGCDAGGTCPDTDYSDIGQTWSQATVTFAAGFNSGDEPLLIMGGGYDDCEDFDNNDGSPNKNHDCASATDGDVIYVIDAADGSVLKTFDTDRAVPGKITVVPIDAENDNFNIMYAYATDAGGNVYRIHGVTVTDADGLISAPPIDSTAPADWEMTKIASLGCDTIDGTDPSDPTCTDTRKFLFGPDVVEDPDVPERFVVLAGTGDREKPLIDYGSAAAISNYFFSIVDQPLVPGWLCDRNYAGGTCDVTTCGVEMICFDALTSLDLDGLADLGVNDVLSPKGWKFELAAGEQVVSGALTLASDVNFSTHVARPALPDSCDVNLGTATIYNMNYLFADGVANLIPGGGLVPTPVGGFVDLGDEIVPFCIGCGPDSPIDGGEITAGSSWEQPTNRVYWNVKE